MLSVHGKKKGRKMTKKKTKKKTKAAAITLAMLLALPSTALIASAESRAKHQSGDIIGYHTAEQSFSKKELELKSISVKNIYTYSKRSASFSSLGKSASIRIINGAPYISLRSFADTVGAKLNYDLQSKTSTLTYMGNILTVGDGSFVMYINNRPIFSYHNSRLMSDGLMYSPLESLASAFRMKLSEVNGGFSLNGKPTALSQKTPYSADEVFWLARIIEAESGGESLLGKIAVGNVVLNRVRSSLYPNTIYGVIFDRKYGVQFSPVLDGRIYNTPSYQATLAAKICLEGFSVSSDALFFLAAKHAVSSWIPNSREYAFSIMNHDFYL